MTAEEMRKQIDELEAGKAQIQAEHDRLLNYQFGLIDGRIALLRELLETEQGSERPTDDSQR